ncbi:type IV secretion system lipoprotein VirB7 [Acidocella sp.]
MIFLVFLSLAACGSKEPLSTCKGSIFALNTGHWRSTPADLVKPQGGQ